MVNGWVFSVFFSWSIVDDFVPIGLAALPCFLTELATGEKQPGAENLTDVMLEVSGLMVNLNILYRFVLQVHCLRRFMLQLCFHMNICCHWTVLTGHTMHQN